MKILVCFKIVSDLDMLSENDWTVDSRFQVDTSFVKHMLNPYDESALEMALRVFYCSGNGKGTVHLTALSVGDPKIDTYLKTLYALRYHHAVRIDTEHTLSSEAIASVISNYVRQVEQQDVIIMGKQSGYGDQAKTPLLTAEMLGWPCLTEVIGFEPYSEDCLKVMSEVDGGVVSRVVKKPFVLAIGNAPSTYLRVPTLKDKMRLGNTPIEVIKLRDILREDQHEKCSNTCKLVAIERIETKRDGQILREKVASDLVELLYNDYIRERLEKL